MQASGTFYNRPCDGTAYKGGNKNYNDTEDHTYRQLNVIAHISIVKEFVFANCYAYAPAVCSWNRGIALDVNSIVFRISICSNASFPGNHFLFNRAQFL